jgi:tetratricopeptide (TPR) repeat protein
MKQCVSIRVEFSEAWKSIGDIYFLTKKFDKALKSYKKCFKYDKTDLDAEIGIGNCYQEL